MPAFAAYRRRRAPATGEPTTTAPVEVVWHTRSSAVRLEALHGRRRGQHSIRVNDQYRLCFVWTPDGPDGVEFVDYHDER